MKKPVPREEHPFEIEVRIEVLEVQIDALCREKERLSRLAQKRPLWRYLLFAIPVVLRGALWVAAGVGVLLVAILVLSVVGIRPR